MTNRMGREMLPGKSLVYMGTVFAEFDLLGMLKPPIAAAARSVAPRFVVARSL
jgi:hypothetical protein